MFEPLPGSIVDVDPFLAREVENTFIRLLSSHLGVLALSIRCLFVCGGVVGEKGVKTRGKGNRGQSQGPVLFSLFSLPSPRRRLSFALARPVLRSLAPALFR